MGNFFSPEEVSLEEVVSLEKEASIISKNIYLIVEVKNNNIEKIKELLNDSKVDPSYEPSHEYCAFTLACEYGHIDIVQLLLQDKRVNPSEGLMFASKNGYTEIVRLLIKFIENNDSKINFGDFKSALYYTGNNGDTKTLLELLKYQRKYDFILYNFAIEYAIQNAHLKIVKELLKDIRVNISDGSAIKLAIQNEDLKYVKRLGLNLSVKNDEIFKELIKNFSKKHLLSHLNEELEYLITSLNFIN